MKVFYFSQIPFLIVSEDGQKGGVGGGDIGGLIMSM